MLVLFDQGTPVPLRQFLSGHRIRTAAEQHWTTLGNGQLLDAAEAAGFEVLLTTDKKFAINRILPAAESRLSCLDGHGRHSSVFMSRASSLRWMPPLPAATWKLRFRSRRDAVVPPSASRPSRRRILPRIVRYPNNQIEEWRDVRQFLRADGFNSTTNEWDITGKHLLYS